MFTKAEKEAVGEFGAVSSDLISNFWRDDNLLGCLGMLLLAPVLFVSWLCGGLKKYVGVRVEGELSVSLDQFKVMLKKKGLKYVGPFETDANVTHVVYNNPELVPKIKSDVERIYRWKNAKIVTEQEFWEEMRSR